MLIIGTLRYTGVRSVIMLISREICVGNFSSSSSFVIQHINVSICTIV